MTDSHGSVIGFAVGKGETAISAIKKVCSTKVKNLLCDLSCHRLRRKLLTTLATCLVVMITQVSALCHTCCSLILFSF